MVLLEGRDWAGGAPEGPSNLPHSGSLGVWDLFLTLLKSRRDVDPENGEINEPKLIPVPQGLLCVWLCLV